MIHMPILNRHLALVAPLTSTDASRPALACVRVAKKDKTLTAIATDSYVAARVTIADVPQASDFPTSPDLKAIEPPDVLLIPAETVIKCAKSISKKASRSLPVLGYAALTAPGELAVTDLETVTCHTFKPCTDAYPDVDRLFSEAQTGKTAHRVTVNASYLVKIAKMFEGLNDGDGLNAVTLNFTGDPTDPIMFTSRDGKPVKGEAMLMPIKL